MSTPTPFSILDLSPIAVGSSAAASLRNSLDYAQRAEQLGYTRYWLAEHHGMPGIASAATAVVIGHIAGGTRSIRIGAGGIMLPNHSPLVIAEQFGTLASLYPGRIDLGLGRAPGSDQTTMRALRRDYNSADRFPQDVQELQRYFSDDENVAVRAVPGAGLDVPIWLLGSSTFGAQLAAMLGLPYAFAAHFAPGQLMNALNIYRTSFQPSAQLAKSYAMVAINVFVAATDADAQCQFTSHQQSFTNLVRGTPGQIPHPIADIDSYWTPSEKLHAQGMLQYAAVGAPDTVERKIRAVLAETQVDELMITGLFANHAARCESLRLTAEIRDRIHHNPASPAG
ncbi:MAG TPA: LLM class flavin-dependent oxidoreductase [Rhodocyclaceae bacterium]|nr:LLM class flavin-dependent oxidoreductase [Rhodocyclaceae bacterium]